MLSKRASNDSIASARYKPAATNLDAIFSQPRPPPLSPKSSLRALQTLHTPLRSGCGAVASDASAAAQRTSSLTQSTAAPRFSLARSPSLRLRHHLSFSSSHSTDSAVDTKSPKPTLVDKSSISPPLELQLVYESVAKWARRTDYDLRTCAGDYDSEKERAAVVDHYLAVHARSPATIDTPSVSPSSDAASSSPTERTKIRRGERTFFHESIYSQASSTRPVHPLEALPTTPSTSTLSSVSTTTGPATPTSKQSSPIAGRAPRTGPLSYTDATRCCASSNNGSSVTDLRHSNASLIQSYATPEFEQPKSCWYDSDSDDESDDGDEAVGGSERWRPVLRRLRKKRASLNLLKGGLGGSKKEKNGRGDASPAGDSRAASCPTLLNDAAGQGRSTTPIDSTIVRPGSAATRALSPELIKASKRLQENMMQGGKGPTENAVTVKKWWKTMFSGRE